MCRSFQPDPRSERKTELVLPAEGPRHLLSVPCIQSFVTSAFAVGWKAGYPYFHQEIHAYTNFKGIFSQVSFADNKILELYHANPFPIVPSGLGKWWHQFLFVYIIK